MPESRSDATNGSRDGKANTKSTQLTIHESFESLKKIVELDIDSSLTDLTLLEKLNNELTLNYRNYQDSLTQFEENTKETELEFDQVRDMGDKLDLLESQVDKLSQLANEIDEWSREVQIKVKRIHK